MGVEGIRQGVLKIYCDSYKNKVFSEMFGIYHGLGLEYKEESFPHTRGKTVCLRGNQITFHIGISMAGG